MATRNLAFAFCMMFVTACGASAQQNVPPPPNPNAAPAAAGNGPSLAETMKFIQDKLTEQDKINYVAYITDNRTAQTSTKVFKFELSNIGANPGACSVSHHRKVWWDGQLVVDADSSFNLKYVEKVVVMSMEQAQKETDTEDEHPELSTKFDPPLFALEAQLSRSQYNAMNASPEFFFYGEDMANRIAKALVHAVELCGGGSKPEPF